MMRKEKAKMSEGQFGERAHYCADLARKARSIGGQVQYYGEENSGEKNCRNEQVRMTDKQVTRRI